MFYNIVKLLIIIRYSGKTIGIESKIDIFYVALLNHIN